MLIIQNACSDCLDFFKAVLIYDEVILYSLSMVNFFFISVTSRYTILINTRIGFDCKFNRKKKCVCANVLSEQVQLEMPSYNELQRFTLCTRNNELLIPIKQTLISQTVSRKRQAGRRIRFHAKIGSFCQSCGSSRGLTGSVSDPHC